MISGSVTRARRVDGRSDLWEITVEPSSGYTVIVTLPETTDCDAEGAVCTSDGRMLSAKVKLFVTGPDTPEPTVELRQNPAALAPSGLEAVGSGSDVTLSWDAPEEDASSVTGYEILRAQGSAALATLVADTGSTGTTYTDSGVTGDLGDYRYQVKALRDGEASQGSNVASVIQSALAHALSDVTLVSNVGQGGPANVDYSQLRAQRFTTGSNTFGITLTSVELISSDAAGDTFAASICTVDTDGYPTESCTSLTPPGSFAAGTIVFTAPADTTLEESTTYTVLINPTSSTLTMSVITSDGEDSGGATGWSIADRSDFLHSQGHWATPTSKRKFRVTIKGILNTDESGSEPKGHDLPADTSTTGVVALGGSATGKIASEEDADWFKVELQVGQTYQIDLEGSPTGQGTNKDPILGGIYDSNGEQIPFYWDSNSGTLLRA